MIFILTIGFLLYRGRINEWAGIFLLGGIAQARGAVGVTGKLASMMTGGGGPPPSDPGGGSAGGAGGGSRPSSRPGGGMMWRLAASSGAVLALSSVMGPALFAARHLRGVGLVAVVAFVLSCVR